MLVPVAVAHRVPLGVPPIRAEPAAAVAREPPQVAVLDRVDVAGAAVDARDRRERPPPAREPRADGVVPLDEPLDRAVEPEPVGNAAPAVGDRRDDVLVVEPDQRHGRQRTEVEQVAEDDEEERAVELLAEAPSRAPVACTHRPRFVDPAERRVVEPDVRELPARREAPRRRSRRASSASFVGAAARSAGIDQACGCSSTPASGRGSARKPIRFTVRCSRTPVATS